MVIREYVDIYNDVDKELRGRTYTSESLFSHCMKTCQRLFAVAEFKPGKPAANLPDEVINDIAELYDKKSREIPDDNLPNGKYDYATSWKDFAEEKEISMYDLSMIIAGKPKDKRERITRSGEGNSAINSDYGDFKKIYKGFLQEYFGYEYDDECSPELRYEMIRLTKILYDCKHLCGVELGFLKRISILQFRLDVPSIYQEAINFIKYRIVTRRYVSEFHLSFQTVMMIERYVNSLKSFLYSFPLRSVDEILSYIPNPSYGAMKYVNKSVYNTVLNNLRGNCNSVCENIIPAEGVQASSYAKFLLKDIESLFIDSKNEIVELSELTYSAIDFECKVFNRDNLCVNNIAEFAEKKKEVLVQIAFPGEVKVDDRKFARKYKDRIKRHSSCYFTLARVYNRGLTRSEWYSLSVREALILISFFEKMDNLGVDIPLYSGYSGGGRRKTQKIMELLKKIELIMNGDSKDILTEEEYFLAVKWLFDNLFMAMRCQTKETHSMMKNMQKALFNRWKAVVPIFNNDDFSMPIEDLIKGILPIESMEMILENAKIKSSMENSYFNLGRVEKPNDIDYMYFRI